METLKKLYPLKFRPILKSAIWGGERISEYKHLPAASGIGESWEISGVPGSVSIVSNGELTGKGLDKLIQKYGASLVGNENIERFGENFPLLIKFIDACDDLSIQVHPNDELAEKRHQCKGKTEMWYVLDAEPGANLYAGFKQQITPDEYVQRVENNTFTDVLALHSIQKGDVFFLPAGVVHAIRKGTFIAEIQQSSDITYRIYDYNRRDAQGNSRQLHTDQAKDAINYTIGDSNRVEYNKETNAPNEIISCPYFTTSMLHLDEDMQLDYSELDSFVVLICLEGACKLESIDGSITLLNEGETILIPACVDTVAVLPINEVRLLETFV